MPIGQVKQPGRRPACLSFSETPPARPRKKHADKDVLRQDPPDEWDNHRQELIQRPQPDQLGIVEMSWNDVLVCGHCTTPSWTWAELLLRTGLGSVQIVAVTVDVTIGTPVPAPTPTPTGIAICPIEKRPEARATTPPARLSTVMILPPD